MIKLKLLGFQADTKLLEEIYQKIETAHNALPLDSDVCVTLTQHPDNNLYRCFVSLYSPWGQAETRETWIKPLEALKAAMKTINEEIKYLRSAS